MKNCGIIVNSCHLVVSFMRIQIFYVFIFSSFFFDSIFINLIPAIQFSSKHFIPRTVRKKKLYPITDTETLEGGDLKKATS